MTDARSEALPGAAGAEPADPGFDLDEDLFGFDEVGPEPEEDDLDLDEIFAAFQEVEKRREGATPAKKAPAAPAPAAAAASASAPRAARDASAASAPAATSVAAATPSAATVAARAVEPDALEIEPPDLDLGGLVGSLVPVPPEATRPSWTRAFLAVAAATTLLNGAVALVAWHGAAAARETVESAGRDMRALAGDIRRGVEAQAAAVQEVFLPVTPPEPDGHPVFQQVESDLEAADFAAARRRLYALLAVIDRFPEDEREDLHTRARYLLARTLHEEALALVDGGRTEAPR